MKDQNCYYAATIQEFLNTDPEKIKNILCKHDNTANNNQMQSWEHELLMLQTQLRDIPAECYIILEYKIPGVGTRPDIIILAYHKVIVLEYKDYYFNKHPELETANQKQIISYESKLLSYHKFFTGYATKPDLYTYLLRPAPPSYIPAIKNLQKTIECSNLKTELKKLNLKQPRKIMLDRFLNESYKPSASLVDLTKLLSEDPEAIPQIRQSNAELKPTLDLIDEITNKTFSNNEHALIILSGVPGAGKSCVGLLETMSRAGDAITITGNGNLVSIIQGILTRAKLPNADHIIQNTKGDFDDFKPVHFLCFDEAQRTWDEQRTHTGKSEAQTFIDIGSKHSHFVILLLNGEGQSIYKGESKGMSLWKEAIKKSNVKWEIYSPEKYEQLNLTKSLRSKNSQDYHEWVDAVINGNKTKAQKLVAENKIFKDFDLKLSQSQDSIIDYINYNYLNKQYGILLHSQNKYPDMKCCEHTNFNGKNILKITDKPIEKLFTGKDKNKTVNWFLSNPNTGWSSKSFDTAATEFDTQGLEIDFPVFEWGNNYNEYMINKIKNSSQEYDIYLKNAYRVLLTRGREGMAIYVPKSIYNGNNIYKYLKSCGCPEL